ncbi:2-dehydro-3-deoxyphosphogluconate aldolase [Dolosicoccus paucivorans]|uniref:2-dehydro-3-deoxyphosphogluconate aldolase n=1 Tax=Dolosicoccus paucivorans TaxID=84521 RepID=A0A2N6SLF8_9LACT|nr:bifunctional 4-hydroxy-2-oxoglutarate aldolase/2-dehydro-3-deoxy-phosphogluconate aldolase [Dolosicoccus paucivorans]PMC57911.1 2-dehydro-3-deoxyphosphogluconate aldolase [Dolosicoccus paucivorans]
MLETMKENYIFAVIRGLDEKDAINISRAAVKGEIKNLEITYTTPNASSVIKDLIEEYKSNEEVVVGAGTVMSLDIAKEAYEAGAKFLVSPHFDQEIADFANEKEIYYMPGCATATEIVTAMNAKCKIIKVFPGGVLGSSFISDIHGPIPEVNLMPSGGVSIDNIETWIEKGAVAVGVGSALSREVADKGYESVTDIAKKFSDKVKSFKK